jgi:hypothetical protein
MLEAETISEHSKLVPDWYGKSENDSLILEIYFVL